MGGSRDEESGHGRVTRAIATSIRGNSTAFGFSIMITATFGMLNELRGSPQIEELFLFGVSAALAIAILEGAITRGFRARLEQTSQEVQMLGTGLNFASVAAGIATAMGVGDAVAGTLAWAAAPFAAAAVYVAVESAELLLAEFVQGARGAPVTETDERAEAQPDQD